MKKVISMLVLCLAVTLTGCSGSGETQSEPKEPVQEETVEEETVQEDEDVQPDDGQGQMELDVDEKFGEQLRSLGTAGEEELMHCVVNSFLDTFSCEKVRITENGDVLVSGHKEYGDYISRME